MRTTNSLRKLRATAFVVCSCSVAYITQAQADCSIASDYDALAIKSEADYLDEAALDYRARAVELCPSFNRWQAYGELAMRFGDAALTTGCLSQVNADDVCGSGNTAAAQAFIAALPLANDDASAAQSIGRYAQVLYQANDPQKANNYISEALRLDPESPWIRELAAEIPLAMNTKEAMRSGLGDFRVPEMVLASLDSPTAAVGGVRLGAMSKAGNPGAADPIRTNAINVPLNFYVSSTRLDDVSRQRLRDVVEILAEDAEREYHIIGHADVTGDSASNQTLSEERAHAIYSMLVTMEPSLDARITHEGLGSTRPLRREMSAEAHRVNRRVEIYVR